MTVKRYAMAKEGNTFLGEGINLSWPYNGEREVVELEEKSLPGRFRQRVANGVIEEVIEEITKPSVEPTPYRLLTREEAKAHMAIPPGPVVVTRHNRQTGEDKEIVIRDTRPATEGDEEATDH